MDQSTSTADLEDLLTDVIRGGRGDSNANYKREVHDKSTVTSPSLDEQNQQLLEKHTQDQATSMLPSPSCSPQPPLVILEDAAETDISLPDFKDHFSDLESSSVEDLLNLDTRPNSGNRKSVTFSDLIDVEIVSPELSKSRTQSPQDPNVTIKPILKKEDKQRETMRRLLEYAAERLYRDLLMLVEERDRSVHALEITPDGEEKLSEQTNIFQRNYRDKLLDNKLALDKRIDQVWTKLKDLPIDGHKAHLVYGVRHSSELTLNMKRRLAVRRCSVQVEKKERNEMEMASDFSRRLSRVREQMIRRESDSLLTVDDNRSMQDLLNSVSRIFGSYEKLTSS
ncbi:hypothetical protein ANCCAN_00487 [Ancylostoma caninum]|uniref:Uncharacterized protein n=1 Tax=Ancylostoma caninum TaxID=29170 RepID=A0A368H9Y9_ANCCA|nr:hypothetical protein ANCCAN_00487 [Ancylostoma caninum]